MTALRGGPTALVPTITGALTPVEVDALVTDVEFGLRHARRTAAGNRFAIGFAISMLMVVAAGGSAAAGFVFCASFALSIIVAVATAAGSDSVVMGLLRHRPDQITSLVANHGAVMISIGGRTVKCASTHADGLCARLVRYRQQAT